MTIGRLLLRTTVGGLFVGHGTQKLFGWFDGHGIDATAEMFSGIGVHPARPQAIAAGVTEAGCGAALVLGTAPVLAAAGLIGTMLTAIRTVHGKNGVWVTKGGYEYNAVLIAACAVAAEGDEESSVAPLLALALGAAGAVGVKLVSDALAPPPDAVAAAADSPAEAPAA